MELETIIQTVIMCWKPHAISSFSHMRGTWLVLFYSMWTISSFYRLYNVIFQLPYCYRACLVNPTNTQQLLSHCSWLLLPHGGISEYSACPKSSLNYKFNNRNNLGIYYLSKTLHDSSEKYYFQCESTVKENSTKLTQFFLHIGQGKKAFQFIRDGLFKQLASPPWFLLCFPCMNHTGDLNQGSKGSLALWMPSTSPPCREVDKQTVNDINALQSEIQCCLLQTPTPTPY